MTADDLDARLAAYKAELSELTDAELSERIAAHRPVAEVVRDVADLERQAMRRAELADLADLAADVLAELGRIGAALERVAGLAEQAARQWADRTAAATGEYRAHADADSRPPPAAPYDDLAGLDPEVSL